MQTVAEAAKRSARRAQAIAAGLAQLARCVARGGRGAGDQRRRAREREIGGIVDLYMRKMGNPAVLFDDIPGYPRGHRILANILTSVRRINLTLGLPIDGSADRARLVLAQIHEGGAQHRAGHGQIRRRCWRTSSTGKDVDICENPDAALARARRRLLHRHRLHGDHAGSRHRLDQLRRLSRAVARPERGDGHVLEGQARRPDQAPLSRARRAVPDRGGGRHASGAVHGGGARNSVRQERIRRRRRPASASRSR